MACHLNINRNINYYYCYLEKNAEKVAKFRKSETKMMRKSADSKSK